MKKKISLLTAFIFIAMISMAQTPFSPVPSGTPQQALQARGVYQGLLGLINGRYVDTATANTSPVSLAPGSQIVVGDTVFLRNQTATKWILIGLGSFHNDTLQAIRPLKIDSISPTLSTIKQLIQRALVYGGTTTMHSCLSIDVIATGVFISYNFYSNPGVTLTVDAPDLSHDRIDAVVIDTLGQISIIPGTPSLFPQVPSINIASQFLLTTYTVKAGASCIGITTEIVYDQNTGPTAEWAPTTFGTLTNDFGNTVNPFHLTIADFVSIYHDGSGIIFTRTGNDTAQAGEILKLYIYSNGIFSNQIKIQFFLGTAPVGNQISFNSGYGFNGALANTYQNTSIPFSAFGLTNQIFNKIVITYAGNDLSGVGGLYNDYIQLQTGVDNTNAGEDHGVFNFVMNATNDTLILTRFDGVIFKVPVSSSGAAAWNLTGNAGTTTASNFIGTTDNNGFVFKINNSLAGWISTSGINDAAFGLGSLPISTTSLNDNSAFGANSLRSTTGNGNAGFGTYSLFNNTTGATNVGVGVAALFSNTTGLSNTGIGTNALYNVTTGAGNAALGDSTLRGITTGSYDIGLGYKAGIDASTVSNTLYISDSTPHMIYGIDTADGIAPSIIGYDPVTKRWSHYANSGGTPVTLQIAFNNSGTAGDDPTIKLNGNKISITDVASGSGFNIDPTLDNEFASFQASNPTGHNNGVMSAYTTDTTGNATLDATANNGAIEASIVAYANSASNESEIIFNADENNFTGNMLFNTVPPGSITDSVLTDSAGYVRHRDAASFGTVHGIDDVLAVAQQLTTNRDIDVQGFTLNIQGTGASSVLTVSNGSGSGVTSTGTISGLQGIGNVAGVTGTSTNGLGVYGLSSHSNAIEGQTTDGIAGKFHRAALAGDADVQTILQIIRDNSGSGQGNGIGVSVDFSIAESTGFQSPLSNQIISKWTDATHATRTSEMSFTGVNSGTTQTQLILNGNGEVRINSGALRLKGYTVATLPTGVQGDIAYCTDLLTPTFFTLAVGGGAVVGTVFYNGTTWVTF